MQVTHSKDIVNFCNLQVLSESALAAQDVCSNQNDNLNTTIGSFGTRCIKVFRQRVATIEEARSVCKNIAGHLLEQMDKNLQDYVNWHLATHFAEEKNTRLIEICCEIKLLRIDVTLVVQYAFEIQEMSIVFSLHLFIN